jgi:hypothetical protein
MKWFLDIPVGATLLVGFGLIVVLRVVVTITAYISITAIQKSQKSLYDHEFTLAVDLENLRSNQHAIQAAALTMMSLTKRSEQAARHQGIKDRSKENDETMRRLLEQVRDEPQLLRRLEEFEAIRSAFRETRETQVMPLIYARKIDEAKGLFTGIQLVRMDQVAVAMENIKQATAQNVASTKQTESAAQNLHDLGQKLKQVAAQYRV